MHGQGVLRQTFINSQRLGLAFGDPENTSSLAKWFASHHRLQIMIRLFLVPFSSLYISISSSASSPLYLELCEEKTKG
jgi:hypothetical protein